MLHYQKYLGKLRLLVSFVHGFDLTLTFVAHWLAIEGVQPSIPQNPASSEARNQDLLPKGATANPNLAAINGADTAGTKPLVKHILSKEAQLYFERICAALLDEGDEVHRLGALASVRGDPGVHQLVPYFVQYTAEKVTHNLKNFFVLRQMLELTMALLENGSLFMDPYINSLVPVVLTCLLSPHLGNPANQQEQYPLRSAAASIIGRIGKNYAKASQTLRPRLARSCLKTFLDPKKPLETHYGAILGLKAVSGREGVRTLIIPNLKEYSKLLQESLDAGAPGSHAAEYVLGAIIGALQELKDETSPLINGYASGDVEAQRLKLEGKFGPLITERVIREGDPKLVQAAMQ
jgi:transcription initiation factor TFIID subunit 6